MEMLKVQFEKFTFQYGSTQITPTSILTAPFLSFTFQYGSTQITSL